jgi:superfamily II DNA/RNA helicase
MRNVPRVLIFANKIKTVVFLHQTLEGAGNKVVMLHGDKKQSEREVSDRVPLVSLSIS